MKDYFAEWDDYDEQVNTVVERRKRFLEEMVDNLPVGIGDKVRMRGYKYVDRVLLITDLLLQNNYGNHMLYVKGNVLKMNGEVSMQNTGFSINANPEMLAILERENAEIREELRAKQKV